MKAVTAHAFVVKTPWQGKGVGHEGVLAVKGGVKTRHLQRLPKGRHGRADAGQVVRLVQRGQGGQRIKLRQHLRIEPHGLGVMHPAVHHAVAHQRHFLLGQVLFQPVQHSV